MEKWPIYVVKPVNKTDKLQHQLRGSKKDIKEFNRKASVEVAESFDNLFHKECALLKEKERNK